MDLLALVGDRKGIQLQNSFAPITSQGIYFPSTPLPSPPSLLLSDGEMVLKRIYGEGESGKPVNPGSPGTLLPP